MYLYIGKRIIVGLLVLFCPVLIHGADIDDPAMKFYLEKTDSVLNGSTLFNNDLKYSVLVTSVYNKISYRGISSELDTAGFFCEFTDGRFVESETDDTAAIDENIVTANLRFEKPWELNCRFYFFPRDTGAGDLAIGFAPADTLAKTSPEGMIIINRDTYQIKRLYLHYTAIDEYAWLSKTYRFSHDSGTVLLRSLTLQGCYYGFFRRRFFRQDLIFDNYDFH